MDEERACQGGQKEIDNMKKSWPILFPETLDRSELLKKVIIANGNIQTLLSRLEALQEHANGLGELISGQTKYRFGLEARFEASEKRKEELENGKVYLRYFLSIVAPKCVPLDDLSGLASQIDHYTVGLRKRAEQAETSLTKLQEAVKTALDTGDEINLCDRPSTWKTELKKILDETK